jgi:hypothetical protein
LSQVLDDHGALDRKGAVRLAGSLNIAGRFEETLSLLGDESLRLQDSAEAQMQCARAEAGLGRLSMARAAVGRALALDPGYPPAVDFQAVLDRMAAAEDRVALSVHWADVRGLIDAYLGLGAAGAARDVLAAYLRSDSVPADAEIHDLHHGLDAILSLLPPGDQYDLFRALGRIYAKREGARALSLVCQGLREPTPDEAVQVDAAWSPSTAALRRSGAMAWANAGKLAPAIDALARISGSELPKDRFSRCALARYIGQDTLARHPMRFAPAGRPKVFDVFPFNNELEMLKIKLGVMAGWVDHFVIVEARQTFTGRDKPLHFEAAKAEFGEYRDKIIHVTVEAFPDYIRFPWAREFHQRDMGLLGLSGRCSEDDLVLISDADEVIDPSVLTRFTGECARLMMERVKFFLNYRERLSRDQQKCYTTLWRAKHLRSLGLSHARVVLPYDKKSLQIFDAGWHFRGVMDEAGLIEKARNTSHQEQADRLEEGLQLYRDVKAGRLEPNFERCEIDERFPDYVRAHRAELASMIL